MSGEEIREFGLRVNGELLSGKVDCDRKFTYSHHYMESFAQEAYLIPNHRDIKVL
jgi:hypothetical protein